MLHGYGIGSVLNDTYRLERELGRGALGKVYAGSNLNAAQAQAGDCAIRVLPQEARDLIVERERFSRDHKIVAQIGDPRLPAMLELATSAEGQLFVVTGLYRGETLRQRLRRGALPARAAFALVEALCEALQAAHERGVTHGAIRPENIVLCAGDKVVLLDLGLHHFRVGQKRALPRRAPGIGWYLAPELVESKVREADSRGDVFALGAVLYEALSGRPAFLEPPKSAAMRGRSGLAQLVQPGRQQLPPEIAAVLEQILETACAVRPEDRLPDAQALGQALRSFQASLPEESEAGQPAAAPPAAAPPASGEEPRAPSNPPLSGRQASESPRRSRRRPLLGAEKTPAAEELHEPPGAGKPEGEGGLLSGDVAGAPASAAAGPVAGDESSRPGGPEGSEAGTGAAAGPAAGARPAPAAEEAGKAPAEGAPAAADRGSEAAPAAPVAADRGSEAASAGPKDIPAGQRRQIEPLPRGPARHNLGDQPVPADKADKPLSPVAARLAALARGETPPPLRRPARQPAPMTRAHEPGTAPLPGPTLRPPIASPPDPTTAPPTGPAAAGPAPASVPGDTTAPSGQAAAGPTAAGLAPAPAVGDATALSGQAASGPAAVGPAPAPAVGDATALSGQAASGPAAVGPAPTPAAGDATVPSGQPAAGPAAAGPTSAPALSDATAPAGQAAAGPAAVGPAPAPAAGNVTAPSGQAAAGPAAVGPAPAPALSDATAPSGQGAAGPAAAGPVPAPVPDDKTAPAGQPAAESLASRAPASGPASTRSPVARAPLAASKRSAGALSARSPVGPSARSPAVSAPAQGAPPSGAVLAGPGAPASADDHGWAARAESAATPAFPAAGDGSPGSPAATDGHHGPTAGAALPVDSAAAAPLGTEPPVTAPGADLGDRNSEAQKAISAARAAAAARLLEAARVTASRQGIPEPAPSTGSSPSARRRRAPANLQEQPPAAGEVVASNKAPPALESSQIIVDLADVAPSSLTTPMAPGDTPAVPVRAEGEGKPGPGPHLHHPPPLPPSVAPKVAGLHLPETLLPDAAPASPAPLPVTRPMRELPTTGRDISEGGVLLPLALDLDDSQKTEEIERVSLVPPRRSLVTVGVPLLTLGVLCVLGVLVISWFPAPRPTPAPVPGPADDVQRRLGEIDRAADVQDWHLALLRADELLQKSPGHPAALDRRRKAEAELQNQARYDSFRSAAERHNSEAAIALYAEIPPESIYKSKASAQAQTVRGEFIASKLMQAQDARRLNLCSAVQRLTQSVLAVDSENEAARSLAAECAAAPQEAERPRRKHPRRETAEGKAPDESQEQPRPSSIKELRDPFAKDK